MYDIIVADFNVGREYIRKNKLNPKKTILINGVHNVTQMAQIKEGNAVVHKVQTTHLDNNVLRMVDEVARKRKFELK
jgi:hypothetical protein